MDSSEPFEPESVRVVERIRDDILDGVRVAGSRLVERDLAEELDVSRVPVRDALRQLVTEGLVTARPRTWAVVREFTDEDIADLQEVRGAMEPLAFRLAAERADDGGIARLRSVLEDEVSAARAGEAVRARRFAADFHEAVVAAAGNALLDELERTLRSRMRWLLGQHDDLEGVADEHRNLFTAIADGDGSRAEGLARRHVEVSRGLPLRKRAHRHDRWTSVAPDSTAPATRRR